MANSKPTIPEMHPRERLTDKARAGIKAYALGKAGEPDSYGYPERLITAVLEAERMPRERLYALLEGKGYRWQASSGLWRKQAPRKPAGEV